LVMSPYLLSTLFPYTTLFRSRCVKLGLVGAFIPVTPLADRPYRHPIYERLWWTAQDVGLPLLLHIGTPRGGVPGCEFTMNLNELDRKSTRLNSSHVSISYAVF